MSDGGPAFPRFVPDGHYNGSLDFEGMTLRDYFAAKAMQAYMTSQPGDFTGHDELAHWSFMVADAMLKARSA